MVASPTPPTRAAEPYRDSPSVQTAVSSCSMPTERRQTPEPAARPSISRSPVTVASCIRSMPATAPSAHFASARAAHFHLSLRCRASPLARTVWPRADDKGSRAVARRLQPDPAGGLTFYPAFPPTDAEVAQLLDTTRRRVGRLLRRRGLAPGDEGTGPADPVAEASLVLAGIVGASVQGRAALGVRPGRGCRAVIHRILAHLGLPGARDGPEPAAAKSSSIPKRGRRIFSGQPCCWCCYSSGQARCLWTTCCIVALGLSPDLVSDNSAHHCAAHGAHWITPGQCRAGDATHGGIDGRIPFARRHPPKARQIRVPASNRLEGLTHCNFRCFDGGEVPAPTQPA